MVLALEGNVDYIPWYFTESVYLFLFLFPSVLSIFPSLPSIIIISFHFSFLFLNHLLKPFPFLCNLSGISSLPLLTHPGVRSRQRLLYFPGCFLPSRPLLPQTIGVCLLLLATQVAITIIL